MPDVSPSRSSALKTMSLPAIASTVAAEASAFATGKRNLNDARLLAASVLSDAMDRVLGEHPDPARLRARAGDREGEVDGEEEGARNICWRRLFSPDLLLEVDSSESNRPSAMGRINSPSTFSPLIFTASAEPAPPSGEMGRL